MPKTKQTKKKKPTPDSKGNQQTQKKKAGETSNKASFLDKRLAALEEKIRDFSSMETRIMEAMSKLVATPPQRPMHHYPNYPAMMGYAMQPFPPYQPLQATAPPAVVPSPPQHKA